MFTCHTTFNRVFDVVREDRPFASRGRVVKTNFSFQDGAGRHYAIEVSGLPRLESGMHVVALLRREADWATLLGWLDLDTGELAGYKPTAPWAALLLSTV